jgi:predicted nucleic acid-binding protein
MSFVLDASVTLSWILDSPLPALAVKTRQALFAGERGMVPALWHLEVANGLVMAERHRNMSAADVLESLSYVENLAAQFIDTYTDLIPVRRAVNSARASRLTSYDAVYLELARQNDACLATLDRDLVSACAKASVQLFE